MANEQKPKELPLTFSVSFDDESAGMPGVTQLLTPNAMSKNSTSKKPPSTPPPLPTSQPTSTQTAHQTMTHPVARESERKTNPSLSSTHSSAKPSSIEITSLEISSTTVASFSTHSPAITSSFTVPPTNASSVTFTDAGSHSNANASSQSSSQRLSQSTSTGQSLAQLGVQFELHFEIERGNFRYARMKGHAQESLALWQQKFYFQMKLNLQSLGIKNSFEEFTQIKDLFHGDAFGLSALAPYVQVMRIDGNTQTCFVLVSKNSLAHSVDQVRKLLGKPAGSTGGSGDDEFKIELAS